MRATLGSMGAVVGSMMRCVAIVVGMESVERPGRVANPLSLVSASWYEEEQLRLVKGTN
jgi:hypothetical protein